MSTLIVILLIISSVILVGINVVLLYYTKLIYDVSMSVLKVSEKLLTETVIIKDETIIIRKDTRIIKDESSKVRELTELNVRISGGTTTDTRSQLTGHDRIEIPDETEPQEVSPMLANIILGGEIPDKQT